MKNIGNALVIHWWEDGYGIVTCHSNGDGKTFNESLLGKVYFNGNQWYSCTTVGEKKTFGPFNSQQSAKESLTNSLQAVHIDATI